MLALFTLQRPPHFCHLNRGKHNSTSWKRQSGLTFYTSRESLSVPAMLQTIWPPAWMMSNSPNSLCLRALVVVVYICCFSSKQLLLPLIYLPVVGFRHVSHPKKTQTLTLKSKADKKLTPPSSPGCFKRTRTTWQRHNTAVCRLSAVEMEQSLINMQKKNNGHVRPADGEDEADEVFKMSQGCWRRKCTNCENTDLSACPSQHVCLHVCEQAVRRNAACWPVTMVHAKGHDGHVQPVSQAS